MLQKIGFNLSTWIVIIITFVLFIAALFIKGFGHDLLLEAAVFLVSVKLILMARTNQRNYESIKSEIAELKEMSARLLEKARPPAGKRGGKKRSA